MRGQTALHTVLHFGHPYEYEGWRLVRPTRSIPAVADLRYSITFRTVVRTATRGGRP